VDHTGLDLCRASTAFLLESWSEELGLFPFSTSVAEGSYVHDYRRTTAIRYTVNTLLGLAEAARATGSPTLSDVRELTERFLFRQYGAIASYADLGLLLVLLRDDLERPAAHDALERLTRLVAGEGARELELQSVAWMLWGLSAAAPASGAAAAAAGRLFEILQRDFLVDGSAFPRHSRSVLRGTAVSFGALVYYLRAAREYAALTGDPRAATQFESGVRRLIDIQGPDGEWPWLISPRSGRALEFYPVFAVHQDSMAMLLLHPALDAGVPSARQAIERSFSWALGRNELGEPMYVDEPFRAFRSIERTPLLPKLDRASEQPRAGGAACYARALRSAALGRTARIARGRRVRVNPECRSYHLGWLLYVWSARLPLLAEVAGTRPTPGAGLALVS
jgi:hypothetical protein